MERCDYLMVGGGVAGVTAAETIRGLDPAASITVVSDEPHPLYSRVLLPNYVKGLVSRERLFLRRHEDYAAKRIALLGGLAAEGLDAGGRALRLSDGRTLGFGKLLIAAGGRPRPLGIPGEGLTGISRFQTVEDADRMLDLLADARRAVVVGGGLIALEYLDILAARRIPTTLVTPHPFFFSRFLDAAGGELLEENFQRHGVRVIANARPAAIEGGVSVRGLRLAGGAVLDCDFVGVGIGLERAVGWLGSSGLRLTPAGVATDEFLETTLAGVFAAGDVADFQDITLGFRYSHGNWGNAFRQGELAGRNMAGLSRPEPYRAVTSYGIRSLGVHIALAGYVAGGQGIETVVRLDPMSQTYGRFFLKGGRLVGAALINRPQDRTVLAELIASRTLLPADTLGRLADPTVDVSVLLG